MSGLGEYPIKPSRVNAAVDRRMSDPALLFLFHRTGPPRTDLCESRALMHGNVVSLVALDLVLWVVLAGVVRIALMIKIF